MSKKRNLFAGLICLLLAFVCLVACDGVTQSPETAAKQKLLPACSAHSAGNS